MAESVYKGEKGEHQRSRKCINRKEKNKMN